MHDFDCIATSALTCIVLLSGCCLLLPGREGLFCLYGRHLGVHSACPRGLVLFVTGARHVSAGVGAVVLVDFGLLGSCFWVNTGHLIVCATR